MEADKVIARMRALGEGATARPWFWDGDEVRAEQGRWHANALLMVVDEMPTDENATLLKTAANLWDLVWGAGGLVEAVDAYLNGHRPFAAYDRMNSALTALIAAAGEEANDAV